MRLPPILLGLILLVSAAPGARAAAVQAEHVEAELIAEQDALVPGGTQWLALRLKPEDGWHTYWRNPGDSGIPTSLKWQLPEGYAAGEIVWPYPERHALGEVTNYGYGDETLHLVPLTVPADARTGESATLRAEAKWLVCSDICIPGSAQLELSLPVAAQAQADPSWTTAFKVARARVPQRADWPAQFAADGTDFSLAVQSAELAQAGDVEFFPYAKDLVNHAAVARQSREGETLRLSQNLSSYFVNAPAGVEGVLVLHGKGSVRAYEIGAAPGAVTPLPAQAKAAEPAPAAASAPSLGLALLLALAGGLILNLMPCVFPVLSLKALSVMSAREHDSARQRAHALAYTAGVVLSCLAVAALLLGLRAGGQALGWGFQLQSPPVIAALAWLFFVLGLALSGAVEFGARFMGLGQSLTQGGTLSSSFFTGVLALVVASPCTAPFMGVALGYAVAQPAPLALAVFAALGLGLASPFLLLGFVPRLAAWLPRPGAWMEGFKQFMAFPLYLTAAWLLWVMTRQAGTDALALALLGVVALAFALWLLRYRGWTARLLRYAAVVGAALLLAHPTFRPAAAPPAQAASETGQQPYSDALLAELRAQKRTVFVNFTADWCLTCKVNERAVLKRGRVEEMFARHHVAYLVGDWTRADPAITAALARFGRSGVPLYLVYRDGGEAEVLPQILTPEILARAIEGNTVKQEKSDKES